MIHKSLTAKRKDLYSFVDPYQIMLLYEYHSGDSEGLWSITFWIKGFWTVLEKNVEKMLIPPGDLNELHFAIDT